MFDAHFILLHVDSPAESARFYAGLLGREPLEQSPTFAMFALPPGCGSACGRAIRSSRRRPLPAGRPKWR